MKSFVFVFMAVATLLCVSGFSVTNTIWQCGFESSEGYSPGPLDSQNGWFPYPLPDTCPTGMVVTSMNSGDPIPEGSQCAWLGPSAASSPKSSYYHLLNLSSVNCTEQYVRVSCKVWPDARQGELVLKEMLPGITNTICRLITYYGNLWVSADPGNTGQNQWIITSPSGAEYLQWHDWSVVLDIAQKRIVEIRADTNVWYFDDVYFCKNGDTKTSAGTLNALNLYNDGNPGSSARAEMYWDAFTLSSEPKPPSPPALILDQPFYEIERQNSSVNITIRNPGTGSVSYTASILQPAAWLHLDKPSGSFSSIEAIALIADRDSLTSGYYFSSVRIDGGPAGCVTARVGIASGSIIYYSGFEHCPPGELRDQTLWYNTNPSENNAIITNLPHRSGSCVFIRQAYWVNGYMRNVTIPPQSIIKISGMFYFPPGGIAQLFHFHTGDYDHRKYSFSIGQDENGTNCYMYNDDGLYIHFPRQPAGTWFPLHFVIDLLKQKMLQIRFGSSLTNLSDVSLNNPDKDFFQSISISSYQNYATNVSGICFDDIRVEEIIPSPALDAPALVHLGFSSTTNILLRNRDTIPHPFSVSLIDTSAVWLSCSPASATVTNTIELCLSINRSLLTAGYHRARLLIDSGSGGAVTTRVVVSQGRLIYYSDFEQPWFVPGLLDNQEFWINPDPPDTRVDVTNLPHSSGQCCCALSSYPWHGYRYPVDILPSSVVRMGGRFYMDSAGSGDGIALRTGAYFDGQLRHTVRLDSQTGEVYLYLFSNQSLHMPRVPTNTWFDFSYTMDLHNMLLLEVSFGGATTNVFSNPFLNDPFNPTFDRIRINTYQTTNPVPSGTGFDDIFLEYLPREPRFVAASDGLYTNSVHITWDIPLGASLYRVFRGTNPDVSAALNISGTISDEWFDDMTVMPGQTNYYWVQAGNNATWSGFSPPDSGFLLAPAASAVSATDGLYTNRIVVTWVTNSTAQGYAVYRNTLSTFSSAQDISGDIGVTSVFNDVSASPGVLYYYWVRGRESNVWGAFSDSDSGYLKLPPPQSVSASDGIYASKITVSWSAAPGADRYRILRGKTPVIHKAVHIADGIDSSEYDDINIESGRPYYYWVQAGCAFTWSDFSNPDSGYAATGMPVVIALAPNPSLFPYKIGSGVREMDLPVPAATNRDFLVSTAYLSTDYYYTNITLWSENDPLYGTAGYWPLCHSIGVWADSNYYVGGGCGPNMNLSGIKGAFPGAPYSAAALASCWPSNSMGNFYGYSRQSGWAIYSPDSDSWTWAKGDGTGLTGYNVDFTFSPGDWMTNLPLAEQGTFPGAQQGFAFDCDADGRKEIFLHAGYPHWDGYFSIYDPDRNNAKGAWSITPSALTFSSGLKAQTYGGSVCAGSKVFCIGGIYWGPDTGTHMQRYDLATAAWTKYEYFHPAKLSDFGIVSLHTNVYLLSGTENGTISPSVYAFNPDALAQGLHPAGSLVVGVRHPAVTCFNGMIYVAGGLSDAGPTNLIQIFDPAASAASLSPVRLPINSYGAAGDISPAGDFYYGGAMRFLDSDGKLYNSSRLWRIPLSVTHSAVPAPPHNVAASDGLYVSKVRVSWSPQETASWYAVYRSTKPDFSLASDISGPVVATQFDDVSAQPNCTYYYRVKAGNTLGWSALSAADLGYVFITPHIAVTNAEPRMVAYDCDYAVIGGTNNLLVSGTVVVSNLTSLSSCSALRDPAGLSWHAAASDLQHGSNHIIVLATNLWNMQASDSLIVYRETDQDVMPLIAITSFPLLVRYESDVASVAGFQDNIAGMLSWSNSCYPSAVHSVSQGFSFDLSPLSHGDNAITVFGTNSYGHAASDWCLVHRETYQEAAPVISSNALIFPVQGSSLEEFLFTNITWHSNAIVDRFGSSDLLISDISLRCPPAWHEYVVITTSVPNSAGSLLWCVPPAVSNITDYRIRFAVTDSCGFTNAIVFVNNTFSLVPEPLCLFMFALVLLLIRRLHATQHYNA